MQATCDPFLYDLTITLRPDRNPDEVLAVVDDEIKRLQDSLVSEQEIQRAIKQARAMFAYGTKISPIRHSGWALPKCFAAYNWFSGYLSRLAEVTPADVLRAAHAGCSPINGWWVSFIPSTEGQADELAQFTIFPRAAGRR